MVDKIKCTECKVEHPTTLLTEGVCVYCNADAAQIAQSLDQPEPQESAPELDAQKEAQKELAKRILSRKRLLPFVERFNPEYEAGWVHKQH